MISISCQDDNLNHLNARMHSYEKNKYEFDGKVFAVAGQIR